MRLCASAPLAANNSIPCGQPVTPQPELSTCSSRRTFSDGESQLHDSGRTRRGRAIEAVG
jgi:hypothetical protein